jgi:acetyl esterase/lipase
MASRVPWILLGLSLVTVMADQGGAAAAGLEQPPLLAPQIELLWPGGAPGAVGAEDADKPALGIFRPPGGKTTATAIVVCPGGSYGHLAFDHEGRQVGDWLSSIGVTAFVLRYRIAPRYHHPAPLQDVQRAIRTVRARAGVWGIDPGRVGVLGFSAGGHLASSAGTHFDDGDAGASDPVDRVSSRPDFMVLAYPVITFEPPYAHMSSRTNLLGADADPKLVETFSNEKQVTARTPPTFLFHTDEDAGVPPENSIFFYQALRKAKVPAELHVFTRGQHGLGLGSPDQALSAWPGLAATWLRAMGFLGRP